MMNLFETPQASNVQAGNVTIGDSQNSQPNFQNLFNSNVQQPPVSPSTSSVNTQYNTGSNPFTNQQNTNQNYNQSQSVQNAPRYRIVDLGWFINEKLKGGQTLNPQEGQIAIISFNADFSNLRIRLANIPQNAIKGSVLFVNELNNLINGTIYPTNLYQYKFSEAGTTITCFEHLISSHAGDWVLNRPKVQLEKHEDKTVVQISSVDNSQNFYFEFINWQKQAFDAIVDWALNYGLLCAAQVVAQKVR